MSDDGGVAAEAEQPGRRRGGGTVRGMVPSLAVVLLAAFVIYLFVPHDESVDPVKPVGYKVELESARRAAPYPVLAPVGLPAKWRATSVRYASQGTEHTEGHAWHLGFVTPDTEYAAVEQSDEQRPAKYVESVTQGARKTSQTVRVRGEEWTRYEGGKYDALVRTATAAEQSAEGKGRGERGASDEARHRPYTTVVTGTASFAQLEKMAEALRPDGSTGASTGGKTGGSGGGEG
ncbi:DUF4245 domain-containing protein [Streptomyces nanshensis]|nr:DUF4245 domain-containing protein [Streptomyces nanshensis]